MATTGIFCVTLVCFNSQQYADLRDHIKDDNVRQFSLTSIVECSVSHNIRLDLSIYRRLRADHGTQMILEKKVSLWKRDSRRVVLDGSVVKFSHP